MIQMNFKDQLSKDLNVFFNPEEFADVIEVDGKSMTVVIDGETLQEHKLKKGEGLNSGKLLFSVRKTDFGTVPIIGKRIKFKGELLTILDFSEDDFTYSITLEERSV